MVRETTIFSEWLTQERNKGWVEGKVEGKYATLQKQLEKRFGELALDFKLSLQKLSSDQLDALTLVISTCTRSKISKCGSKIFNMRIRLFPKLRLERRRFKRMIVSRLNTR